MTWVQNLRDPDQSPKQESAWPLGLPPDNRREAPAHHDLGSDPPGLMSVSVIPDDELQALMEAAPGDEPATDADSGMQLREAIQDAIDALPDRQRWVFDAHVNRGMGFRAIAHQLSVPKTTVHRWFQDAQNALQAALRGDPLVRPHLIVSESEVVVDG